MPPRLGYGACKRILIPPPLEDASYSTYLFGALAEFERNLIRERTRAGLSAARARGHKGGRKKRLDPAKQKLALQLYHERKHTVEEICRLMGIGRSTLYNYLTEAERLVLQQT
jgi:DNA invertase Pin-like site-specific DNA recombinase